MAAESSPYWNILSILGTAIVTFIATMYMMKGAGVPAPPGGPSGFGSLVKDTIAYLPHIMLLFGVLADAVTYEGVYSIPSAVGLLSIPANWLLSYFWELVGTVFSEVSDIVSSKGAFPIPARPGAVSRANPAGRMAGGAEKNAFSGNYDGCEVQGFAWARSKYAPQTLVVTATIFFFYIFDIALNRGAKNAAALITLFIALYVVQVFIVGDCPPDSPGGWEPGKYAKAAIAAIEGMLFGGVSYSIVQNVAPERLPSSAISLFPRKSASQLKPGPNGSMVDSDGVRYNCLPNGQCVPDLTNTESRTAIANSIGENIGTGTVAVPENCPASSSR